MASLNFPFFKLAYFDPRIVVGGIPVDIRFCLTRFSMYHREYGVDCITPWIFRGFVNYLLKEVIDTAPPSRENTASCFPQRQCKTHRLPVVLYVGLSSCLPDVFSPWPRELTGLPRPSGLWRAYYTIWQVRSHSYCICNRFPKYFCQPSDCDGASAWMFQGWRTSARWISYLPILLQQLSIVSSRKEFYN